MLYTQALPSRTTFTDRVLEMHRVRANFPLSMVNINANQHMHEMSRHSPTKTRVHELS